MSNFECEQADASNLSACETSTSKSEEGATRKRKGETSCAREGVGVGERVGASGRVACCHTCGERTKSEDREKRSKVVGQVRVRKWAMIILVVGVGLLTLIITCVLLHCSFACWLPFSPLVFLVRCQRFGGVVDCIHIRRLVPRDARSLAACCWRN